MGRRARYASGLTLIGVGAALLAYNLNILRPGLRFWWPLGLVAVGAGALLSQRKALFPGLFFSLTGLYLLLWNNSYIPKGAGSYWPALVVIGGVSLIAGVRGLWALAAGVGLVSVGGLFLVDNYYMLPWSPGEVLAKGWPVLLILWGTLRLLRRSP
ncbi:MAG TPA: hypothetical protein EYP17_05830 [Candidatus Latescibacteria bacterium]|nr:hypothetical protein [Candidatus Latescibacterota bacterium]